MGICNLWCSNITKKEKKKKSHRGLDQRLEKETKRIVLLNKMKWQSKTFISSFRNHDMQFLYSISLFQYPCPTLTEPLISVQLSLLLGYTIDFERPWNYPSSWGLLYVFHSPRSANTISKPTCFCLCVKNLKRLKELATRTTRQCHIAFKTLLYSL